MAYKANAHSIIFLLLILMMTVRVAAITSKTSIELVNGGYTNVVVAIDDSLEENNDLVQKIQQMFTDGSLYLYQATRKRVFFQNVTILIPSHWTKKPEYRSPGRLTFDVADVIVAPPNPLWAPMPYTQQVQGCGKPGSYIHFMDEFLTGPDAEWNYGSLGRALVHEWGHLRWGLFNEYPDPVGDQTHVTTVYQSSKDGTWTPVSCSLEFSLFPLIRDYSLTPSYRKCRGNESVGYEEGCFFIPYDAGNATGSIMFGVLAYEQIVNFCDDDSTDPGNLHNRESPNKHNRLCDSRSAWEVMREHEDFKDGNSPASDLRETDILPTFTLVQSRDVECRIVLVIDTSGSMSTNDRILKAISASTAFIDLVTEGTWVGIVTFTGSHIITHHLVQVSSPADRSSLRYTLGLAASGGTCIGCGLEGARQVLLQHPSRDLAGADIILMTDGEDSGFADHSIRETLIGDGVRINTIAIGVDAYGELNTVAEDSGGSSFYYGDYDGSAELITSLTQTADKCTGVDTSKRRVQIIAIGFSLAADGGKNGSFYIDPSVGNGTEFIVTYTHGSGSTAGVALTLTQPNGGTIASVGQEYNEDLQRKVILVAMEGRAESGQWTFSIVNTYAGSQSVTFSVYSRPNTGVVQAGEGPLSIKTDVSASTLDLGNSIEALVMYAEVKKGTRPVINATVKATVERPGGDPVVYDLLDNGAGADITANDGVYSRSFTEYDGSGYYGISITAENDGNAVIVRGPSGSRLPPFINITKDGQVISDGSIGNYKVRLPGDPIFDNMEFEKAESFTRSSSAGSTNVPSLPQGFTPGQDLFPPSRVQDLRVKMTSVEDSSVVLIWTAPGDDLDIGNATLYDIRMSHSSALLSADFSNATQLELNQILEGNVFSPKPFGSMEMYVIKVPDVPAVSTFSYAFALRATDDAGLMSPVSNAVTATFRRVIPTAPRIGPCDGMVCHNGGTLDEIKCKCSCSDEFQGDVCQHVKLQLRNGVQIDLFMDRTQCQKSATPLRASVAAQLNSFCNNNFDTCCPESGRKSSSDVIQFLTENKVRIASGYPVTREEYSCYFVVYALRPASPELCAYGSSPSLLRQKRDEFSNNRRRSNEPVYVSRDTLFEAIQSGKEGIENNLMDTTSTVSITKISFPSVEGDVIVMTTSTPPAVFATSTSVVVVTSLFGVLCILCIVFATSYTYKKCSKMSSNSIEEKESDGVEMA